LEQEIRFCTAEDGVRIAWSTVGEGPPIVKAGLRDTSKRKGIFGTLTGWLRRP
jgi:hypothetical protein